MREINHRVKNQFAVVLAVIRQTATCSRSIEDFEKRVRERIMALSYSHDRLSQVDWAGVRFTDLLAHQLRPFEGLQTVGVFGPEISLDANAVSQSRHGLPRAHHQCDTLRGHGCWRHIRYVEANERRRRRHI
ncbi:MULTISPECIES: HWE histidine kinase domain-containing protein [unclassified Rhizobium]|uniref:HWE histidine kinase domain-containing protein n=1 Tax=unclassified Rhizobium TaxID=2613769 RepID=UPI00380D04AD